MTASAARASAATAVIRRALRMIALMGLAAIIASCTLKPFHYNDTLHFAERIDAGEVDTTWLAEVSGIVASRSNPNVLWVHNDSGDKNRIYAINTSGHLLGIYYLAGCPAHDWEDIALGPGPVAGQTYLYVGDIGDNLGSRKSVWICRVAEPEVDAAAHRPAQYTLTDVASQKFKYADGPRDAETLLVDPLNGDVYVVSKSASEARVYRGVFRDSSDEFGSLTPVATLPLAWASAGDVSGDGRHILIKTLFAIYHWDRDPNQPLWRAFAQDPTRLPYVREPQGEAVAWDALDRGYYTLSERVFPLFPHLYYYPRADH